MQDPGLAAHTNFHSLSTLGPLRAMKAGNLCQPSRRVLGSNWQQTAKSQLAQSITVYDSHSQIGYATLYHAATAAKWP